MTASFPPGEKKRETANVICPNINGIIFIPLHAWTNAVQHGWIPFPPEAPLLVNLAFLFTFFSRNAREWHVMLLAFIFFFCRRISAGPFCAKMHSNKTIVASPPPLDCILQAEGVNESTFRKKRGAFKLMLRRLIQNFFGKWQCAVCVIIGTMWVSKRSWPRYFPVNWRRNYPELIVVFVLSFTVQHRLRHRQ